MPRSLAVEERIVEFRVFDDALHLVLAERFGVLLSSPGFDLPAGLAVERRDAGQSAEREFFAHEVWAAVLVRDDRLEAAAAVVFPVPTHGLHGAQTLGATDTLRIACDDLIRAGNGLALNAGGGVCNGDDDRECDESGRPHANSLERDSGQCYGQNDRPSIGM